jgi:hypothetical protein
MKRAWQFFLLALAVMALGCAACSSQAQQQATQSSETQQMGLQQPAREPNRFIYVTGQGLPGACYEDLGSVKFTEPYTDLAIDPDLSNAAERLRKLALQHYPDRVDAVIGVRSKENEVGTFVTITGEAVELHKGETVTCVMRKVPGALNAAAATAAGGIVGTLAGGLTTGSTVGAMGGAAGGMAIAGGYEALKAHRENVAQHNELVAQLQAQRREIEYLQAERAQLRKCVEQETPRSQCTPAAAPVGSATAQEAKTEAADWSAPPYELQRQIQEQQIYIKKLSNQIYQTRGQLKGS